MSDNKSQEQEKIENILANDPIYLLFSTTAVVDGKRKFIDIPIITIKDSYPHRTSIFMYAMEFWKIEDESRYPAIMESFSIINVHKFDSKIQYELFIGEPINKESDDEE